MNDDYDVVILGGGVVGVLCGIGLKKAGVSVLLVEKRECILRNSEERVFALSKRSKEIMSDFGVWNRNLDSAKIEHIMIYDEDGPSKVHYDSSLLGDKPMGYVVRGSEIAKLLLGAVSFDVICSSTYSNFATLGDTAELSLTSGRKINTRVVICADGRDSSLRKELGVKETNYSFDQSSLVCNISHKKNHKNTAIEHFCKGGPFALLPMHGGHLSSVVWTERTSFADRLKKLERKEFTIALQEKCFDHLGKIELESKVYCFPLSMMVARKKAVRHAIFLGEAAHSLHPVAGQGLNLGIRDVFAVVETLKKYKEKGVDLGREFILNEIVDRRALDNVSMAITTTFVNNLFSSESMLLKIARRAAMTVVEMSPTAKKILMSHAMGMGKICR